MIEKIYIISGSVGEYSSRVEWCVAAFSSESEAEKNAQALRQIMDYNKKFMSVRYDQINRISKFTFQVKKEGEGFLERNNKFLNEINEWDKVNYNPGVVLSEGVPMPMKEEYSNNYSIIEVRLIKSSIENE